MYKNPSCARINNDEDIPENMQFQEMQQRKGGSGELLSVGIIVVISWCGLRHLTYP